MEPGDENSSKVVTEAPPSAPILVGRSAELGLGDRCLDAIRNGQGVLLLISGEAGIGKTSLATAIGRRAETQGAFFAVGRCFETGGMPAFAPWTELLAGPTLTATTDLSSLPPPFGTGAPLRSAYELMRSVVTGLGMVARERPLVLLLDDLHWADPDTLELLWFVTRELESTRLAVLATYRAEEVNRAQPLYAVLPRLQRDCPVETIRMTELSQLDTALLVETRYGPCSPEMATHLHARAEGNPFYLVQLLRDFAERQLLIRDDEGRLIPPAQSVDVPMVLQHIITQRVARLGEDVETLLSVASVVGQEWELALVETLLSWDEARLLRCLETALSAHVIVAAAETTETYRFGHALIRDTLYGQQVGRRRKQLHGRIGVALEARIAIHPDPAAATPALAYQFASAEDWTKAVQYALSAGDTARDRYATQSALRLYEMALHALQRSQSGVAAVSAGFATQLHERIGRLHMVLNQQEQAERAFTQMLESAHAHGNRLAEGEALAWQCLIRTRLNRMGEAMASGDAALQVAAETSDTRLRALAHQTIGHAHEVIGELVVALDHMERAAQLAREGQHRDVLGLCLPDLAVMAMWRGDYLRAEQLGEESLELARANHDALSFGVACFRLGLARGEIGRYEAAREVVQLGLDNAAESGERRNLAKLLNTMGWLHDELGDVKTARQWDQRALQAARHGHDVWVMEAELYSLLNLATGALHVGEIEAAEAYLGEIEPLLDRSQYARFRYLNRYQLARAETALARQANAEARRWAEEARALATAKGIPKNVAKSWLVEGRALLAAGSSADAVDRLRHGVALADALAHGSLRWQGRLWLGHAYASRRDAAAATVYKEALDRVESIARELTDISLRACFLGSPLVQEVRNAVAQLKVNPPKPGYPVGLTAREVEVLRLVAAGATNSRIAEVLSISSRTVDVHMTSILGKTGCANRVIAAAFAQRHGLT